MSSLQAELASAEAPSYGEFADAVGGLATIVLAVMALSGLHPSILVAIAAVIFSAAFAHSRPQHVFRICAHRRWNRPEGGQHDCTDAATNRDYDWRRWLHASQGNACSEPSLTQPPSHQAEERANV